MTRDEAKALEMGIGFGLAIAAGMAGACGHMTPNQIATMLDAFATQEGVLENIARRAMEHARQGREVTPQQFRDVIIEAMRLVVGSRSSS